jgi:hypothetical protein
MENSKKGFAQKKRTLRSVGNETGYATAESRRPEQRKAENNSDAYSGLSGAPYVFCIVSALYYSIHYSFIYRCNYLPC